MNQSTSPNLTFASQDDAEAYEEWFRQQVESALAEPGPLLPHEQAVQEIRALVEERRKRRTSNQS